MCSIVIPLLIGLRSSLWSRTELQVEIAALHHQLEVVAAESVNPTAAQARRSILLDLVVSAVALLATCPRDRPAPDRPGLASPWLRSLSEMEESQTRAGQAGGLARRESTDPQDERFQPWLGCTAHPRRVAQAWYRRWGDERGQVHDSSSQALVTDLAHFPGEASPAVGSGGLFRRTHFDVSNLVSCSSCWPPIAAGFCIATSPSIPRRSGQRSRYGRPFLGERLRASCCAIGMGSTARCFGIVRQR